MAVFYASVTLLRGVKLAHLRLNIIEGSYSCDQEQKLEDL
jgi:hypothetical protein